MLVVTPNQMANLIAEFSAYMHEERMRAPLTVRKYRGILEDFGLFLADRHGTEVITLEAVSKGDLVDFLRACASASAKPRAMWNLKLAALRSFYAWLYREERIEQNPALRVERQKVSAKESIPLTFDEMLRLLAAVEELASARYRTRNVAVITVLYHSGLRVSEVASLNLDQVDLDNRLFLGVRRKGDKVLSAAFNDVVAQALEAYLADRPDFDAPQEPALFLSDRKQRLSVGSIQRLVKRAARHAGISRPVTPHLLRHSSATQLVALGNDIRVVQEVLGHASLRTTQRYTHVNHAQTGAAVDRLGQWWQDRVGGES